MPRPETPLLTVDVVVEKPDDDQGRIVLIERHHEPLGWALPGGFVDVGETVEQAAMREIREETGLEVRLVAMLGVYSDPRRDPRGHNVSVTFVGRAVGEPRAGDDARTVRLFDPAEPPPLAFDHGLILHDYLRWRDKGEPAPVRPLPVPIRP